MELIVIILVPPIMAFLVLVFWQPGMGYLLTLGLVVVVSVLLYMDAVNSKASGPDDWFHGIHALPAMASLGIALCISIAQGIRWWRLRKGLAGHYVIWLVGVSIIGVPAWLVLIDNF